MSLVVLVWSWTLKDMFVDPSSNTSMRASKQSAAWYLIPVFIV